MTDLEIEELWRDFSNTPITDEDEIDEKFMDWEIGTNRFVIWLWFDKVHSKGVNFLLTHKKDN